MVAVPVVDLLEAIDVEEHQRDDAAVSSCASDGVLETVGEQRSVDQPGEGVVASQEVQTLLVQLPLEGVGFRALFPAVADVLRRRAEQKQRLEDEQDHGGRQQEILGVL